jgi:O-antigen ligase
MSAAAPAWRFSDRVRDLREGVSVPPGARRAAAIAGLAALGAFWGAAVSMAGSSAAILCVSLVACTFCLRDFRAGVVMLIAIMPISQSYVFPHEMFGITGLNPLNLLLATTVIALVMRTAGDGTLSRLVPRSLGWLYVVPLVVGAALGAPHAGEIPAIFRELEMVFFDNGVGYVRDMLLKPLTLVAYALLVAVAVARSDKPERFIAPMALSVGVMASVVVVFVAISGASLSDLAGVYARQFFSPLGMHANDLGRLYGVAYALLLFIWDRTDRIGLKTLMLFAMGVVVLALLLTFSRGAFFGFILVNIIYLFSRRHVKTLLIAALLIPVGLYFTPGAVWDRVTMGWGDGVDTISAGRVDEIWAPIIPELWNSPIWGNGLGSIMWSRPMIAGILPQVAHPHNAYLEAILNVGVAGLVLLLAYWAYAWRWFKRLGHDTRLDPALQGFFEGAAAGLVSFLVAGFAGSSLAPAPEQAFLWLAVGLMYGVRMKLGPPAPAKN